MQDLQQRNEQIRAQFAAGVSRDDLSTRFGLAVSTIRKLCTGVVVGAALVGSVGVMGTAHAAGSIVNGKISFDGKGYADSNEEAVFFNQLQSANGWGDDSIELLKNDPFESGWLYRQTLESPHPLESVNRSNY